MPLNPSITVIKAVHSFIWAIMATAVFFILYSGITGEITTLTYIAIGLLVLEIAVLSLNRWACPLTNMAQAVKPDWQNGDDIFLPTWVAIHNKTIFGTLFIVGIVLVALRLLV